MAHALKSTVKMEKRLKKSWFFCTLIIGVILILSLNLTNADTLSDLERQIREKEAKIAELEKKAAAMRAAIKDKKAEEASLSWQINIFESQINKLETEIELTQEKISESILKIEQLKSEIRGRELDLNREKIKLENILRIIYEYDQESPLEIVLKNETFSDFLNQIQYAENLEIEVTKRVREIKNIKTQLEEDKKETVNQKIELENLKTDLDKQENSLDTQKTEKEVLFRKTKGEEQKYQKLLNDILAQKAAFAKEIQALENQIIAAKNFKIHVQSGKIPPPGTKIFIWPEDSYILTQGYGMTSFAKRGAYGGSPHNGIDISGGFGTPIKVVAPGEILAKGTNKGWGNWVAVQHSNNLVTLYAHMKSPSILSIGTQVETGNILGYEGSTGFSTGSHLHFSVYSDFFTYEKNGELYFNYFEGTLNPLNYL